MPEQSATTSHSKPSTLIAVPNVSVGQEAALVTDLVEAFTGPDEVRAIAEPHYDRDHGRAVFTLAGPPGQLLDGLVAGGRLAVEAIDFTAHVGSHPCVGVLDVAPLVYLNESQRGIAWVEALVLADRLGHDEGLPVFLYGEPGGSRTRAELRRGGLKALVRRVEDGLAAPDFGPRSIAPRTGAVLITARPPLVAFNVELAAPAGIDDAVAIAGEIREGGERGLPGVRAIGLRLDERGGVAQVSVNVEDPWAVPLVRVVDAVGAAAPVRATELVGLAPAVAFADFPEGLECRNRATLEDALGF